MSFIRKLPFARLAATALTAALALPIGIVVLAPTEAGSQAGSREITVTVHTVKAVDKMDVFSKGDFFARVTINGQVQNSPVVRQKDQITPEWKLSARVPAGQHNVKLAIFDKDLTKEEPIDINKVPTKRDLDFTVNTRGCRVGGFSTGYRCGDRITRAGTERKAAEITFSVDVK